MSIHADAVHVLSAWSTDGSAEPTTQDELRRAFLEFLAEHPDGTDRACRAGHLTASALVVQPTTGRVLLTRHATVGRWLQTGGHCEADDGTVAAAALREAREESGIDDLELVDGPVHLDRHEVRCRHDGSVTALDHLDVQYLAIAPPAAVAHAEGSAPLRWFAFDQLPTDADGAVRALVDAAARLPVE